jgi:hypothetical protein
MIDYAFGTVGDHGKVIEKTLPCQPLECWGVLGIVSFGGAEEIRTLTDKSEVMREDCSSTFYDTWSLS